jgi:hypothetical protein
MQPAEGGCTTFDMVLGGNIPRSIEVGMQREATGTTHEQIAGTTVVTGNMPAPAACLGGMSRIDRNHYTTPFLGLVPDKALQLGKRPGVDTAARFRFAPHLCMLPNTHCRLERQSRIREDARRHANKAPIFAYLRVSSRIVV